MLLYQILANNIHRKIKKSYRKTINLKYQLQRKMAKFQLPDHIL